MTKVSKKFDKGIVVRPTTTAASVEGEIRADSADNKIKVYLNGSERKVVTADQAETLTTKTIDADSNTITNIDNADIKAGAAIARNKLASGTANRVLVNDGSGVLSDAAAITASRALVSNASGIPTSSAVTSTELGHVSGVTSAIQTQLNAKASNTDLTTHTGASTGVHGVTGAVVGTTDAQALTNKTINADSNTITNIDNADIKAGAAIDAAKIANGTVSNTEFQYLDGVTSALQTQLNAKASNTDLTTHTGASTGVHGVTGAVVGTTDSQTLTNKTITTSKIGGGTASATNKTLASKATFSSLDAITKEEASIYYATDAKKLYLDNGTSLVEVGTGSGGGINHIANNTFEVNADGWAAYADAAGVLPVDGTGGSPVTTIVRSTSAPLRGEASGLWSKSANNRQGEGFSYAFTIDVADQSKPLDISFDYTTSANYVDGDMRVFVYDVTNARIIEPSQRDLLGVIGQGSYRGFFQASADSVSYRLIVHVATVSALAYDVKLDNVRLGPIAAGNAGTFVSDWERFTPVLGAGWGTPTNVNFFYRRVGDSMDVVGSFNPGVTTATAVAISISPLGLVFNVSPAQVVGKWWRAVATANTRKTGTLYAATDAFLRVGSDDYTTAAQPTAVLNGNVASPGTELMYFTANSVKVLGWETGIKASEPSKNREVAFHLTRTGGTQTISSTGTHVVAVDTVILDTTGSFDSSNNSFIIPESGLYQCFGGIHTGGLTVPGTSALQLRLHKNGAGIYITQIESTSLTQIRFGPYAFPLQYFNKGDFIQMAVSSADDSSYTLASGSGSTVFSGYKIASPATILPTETVACRYTRSTAQTVSSTTKVIFTTKVHDTHNAYNTSTGNYTVPTSGYYQISAFTRTTTGSFLLGQVVATYIYVDGVEISAALDRVAGVLTNDFGAGISQTIYLSKGSVLDIRHFNSLNVTTIASAPQYMNFSLIKIG